MKTENWMSIFLSIVVFAVIIMAVLLVLAKLGPSTEEDGKCHSTWEYQMPFYSDYWYVPIILVVVITIILVLIIHFIVPTEEQLKALEEKA
jgi:heme/copper-type cytochrome/quinol oxidase subunit 2